MGTMASRRAARHDQPGDRDIEPSKRGPHPQQRGKSNIFQRRDLRKIQGRSGIDAQPCFGQNHA